MNYILFLDNKMHRFEIFAFEKYTVTLKPGLEVIQVIGNGAIR